MGHAPSPICLLQATPASDTLQLWCGVAQGVEDRCTRLKTHCSWTRLLLLWWAWHTRPSKTRAAMLETWECPHAPLSFDVVPSLKDLNLTCPTTKEHKGFMLSDVLRGTTNLQTLKLDFQGEMVSPWQFSIEYYYHCYGCYVLDKHFTWLEQISFLLLLGMPWFCYK